MVTGSSRHVGFCQRGIIALRRNDELRTLQRPRTIIRSRQLRSPSGEYIEEHILLCMVWIIRGIVLDVALKCSIGQSSLFFSSIFGWLSFLYSAIRISGILISMEDIHDSFTLCTIWFWAGMLIDIALKYYIGQPSLFFAFVFGTLSFLYSVIQILLRFVL